MTLVDLQKLRGIFIVAVLKTMCLFLIPHSVWFIHFASQEKINTILANCEIRLVLSSRYIFLLLNFADAPPKLSNLTCQLEDAFNFCFWSVPSLSHGPPPSGRTLIAASESCGSSEEECTPLSPSPLDPLLKSFVGKHSTDSSKEGLAVPCCYSWLRYLNLLATSLSIKIVVMNT